MKTATLIVKGREKVVGSFYLNDKQMEKLGTPCTCIKCKDTFQAGVPELFLSMLTRKPKGFVPKTKVDLFEVVGNDLYLDNDETPITAIENLNTLSLQEKAIVYGMQDFNTRLCPSCYEKNKSVDFSYDPHEVASNGKKEYYSSTHED